MHAGGGVSRARDWCGELEAYVEDVGHGELGHGHLLDAAPEGQRVAVLLLLRLVRRRRERRSLLCEPVDELVHAEW